MATCPPMDRQLFFGAQTWLSPSPWQQRNAHEAPDTARRRLAHYHGAASLHLSHSEQYGDGGGQPPAGPNAPDAVFLQFATSTASADATETELQLEALQGGEPAAGVPLTTIRLVLDGTPWYLDAASVQRVLVSAHTYNSLPSPCAPLVRAASCEGRPEFVTLVMPHVMLNIYDRTCDHGSSAAEQQPLSSVATTMAAACQEAAAAAAASSAAARVRGGAGPSSSSGGGGSDGGSAPWDAQSLVNASLWLEGASCEARQLALLCACQQQAAPGASASSRHLLNSLAQLHAGLRQQSVEHRRGG